MVSMKKRNKSSVCACVWPLYKLCTLEPTNLATSIHVQTIMSNYFWNSTLHSNELISIRNEYVEWVEESSLMSPLLILLWICTSRWDALFSNVNKILSTRANVYIYRPRGIYILQVHIGVLMGVRIFSLPTWKKKCSATSRFLWFVLFLYAHTYGCFDVNSIFIFVFIFLFSSLIINQSMLCTVHVESNGANGYITKQVTCILIDINE